MREIRLICKRNYPGTDRQKDVIFIFLLPAIIMVVMWM